MCGRYAASRPKKGHVSHLDTALGTCLCQGRLHVGNHLVPADICITFTLPSITHEFNENSVMETQRQRQNKRIWRDTMKGWIVQPFERLCKVKYIQQRQCMMHLDFRSIVSDSKRTCVSLLKKDKTKEQRRLNQAVCSRTTNIYWHPHVCVNSFSHLGATLH